MEVSAVAVRQARGIGKLLRAWWPEVLTAALLTAVGLAGQRDDPLFAVFEALVIAAGWAMGRRHRLTPIRQQLEKIDERVEATYQAVLADAGEAGEPAQGSDSRPHLFAVPNE